MSRAHHNLAAVFGRRSPACWWLAVAGIALLGAACDKKPTALQDPAPAAGPAANKGIRDGGITQLAGPPVLSKEVSGFQTGDSDVTIKRCRMTGWSYQGCADQYPVQGRKEVAYQCATEAHPTARRAVCRRLAEYYVRGVGGRVDRNRGLSLLRKQCAEEKLLSCYSLAEFLRDDDLGRAIEFGERACSRGAKNPVSCRSFVTGLRAQRDFDVIVTEAQGARAFQEDSRCRLWVTRSHKKCQARLWCGPEVLYGAGSRGGSFACDPTLRGAERKTSKQDLDGAIEIDVDGRTLRFWDQGGRLGEVTLRGTLSER